MTYSDPLRDRNLTIFSPSRPSKPSFSVERVVVFDVFAVLRSNGLLDLFSDNLGSIFGSSRPLRGPSGDHFSGPKGMAPIGGPPPFWRICVQVRFRPPKWSPRSPRTPQNDPQTSQNPAQNRRPQIAVPPRYFTVSPQRASHSPAYLLILRNQSPQHQNI